MHKRFTHLYTALSFVTLLYAEPTRTNTYLTIFVGDIITIIPFNGDRSDKRSKAEKSFKEIYLDAINEARSQTQDCGDYGVKPPAPPLRWNDDLYQAAYLHSYDMAKSDTFSHEGSGTQYDTVAQALHPGEGSTMKERIEYSGYKDWSQIGENIAAGYTTVEGVIAAWLSSPGHCKNLMNPDFEEVGMAEAIDSDSRYGYYWTQDFGTKQQK